MSRYLESRCLRRSWEGFFLEKGKDPEDCRLSARFGSKNICATSYSMRKGKNGAKASSEHAGSISVNRRKGRSLEGEEIGSERKRGERSFFRGKKRNCRQIRKRIISRVGEMSKKKRAG